MQAVDKVTPLNPEDCVPFVGEALRRLRAEVRTVALLCSPRRRFDWLLAAVRDLQHCAGSPLPAS